jgi:dTDP-glucose 4,6-dehydratase
MILFVNKYPDCSIYNLENLTDIGSKENYKFINADSVNAAHKNELCEKCKFDFLVHLQPNQMLIDL